MSETTIPPTKVALATRLRELLHQFSYIPKTLRLVWRAAPGLTLLWSLLLIVQGVLPAATVTLTKHMIDSLVVAQAAQGAWEQVRPALLLVMLTAGVVLLGELLHSVSDWIRTSQSEYVQDQIKDLVHEKSIAVDLAFYESPAYFDGLDQALSEANSRSLSLLQNSGSLLQNGITLFAMGAVLLPYGTWLPLVLFISALPALWVVLHFDRRYHAWWKGTTSSRRRAQYYDIMLTHSVIAAELRQFDLGPYFRTAYRALRRRLRAEQLVQLRNQSLGRLAASALALLVAGATLAWMVWRALQGELTLGDLGLFYMVFNRGQGLMRALLSSAGSIYTNSLFLGNLFTFLALEPQVVDPPHPLPAPSTIRKGLTFRQVTFRYPGSERPVLQDFNLTVPAGKIVAIVGPNGAGKTTLIKLLCRLYDPQCGSIELDGIPIAHLAIADLRRQISVLFQAIHNHHATAAQNIAFGDVNGSPSAGEIERAARYAGAHEFISQMPCGYATMLGKWFDNGVELSVGEWQRIAMSRAFLRQAPLMLLDEPTSAMDSWAEADWFDRFRTLVAGRMAIIITHRFTIAMRADMIHVMEGGQIVESGSHHELIAQGGLYARSWASQMAAGGAAVRDELARSSEQPLWQQEAEQHTGERHYAI
ncbi:MAG: ABC transporter ATP-binding protein [Caldilineaceae bacterium]|nr:ABC transporter ATP-binding protein [Caldilineaceae bacterium]